MSTDYDKVALSWKAPSANATRLRLIRSRTGYAVSEVDGEIILDTPFPPTSFLDFGLPPATRFYYTIYVTLPGGWVRAGMTSILTTKDQGFGLRLFEHLPQYHQYGQRALTNVVQENTQLHSFMNVFGWGFDYLKTYYDDLLTFHDTDKMSVENLERLAAELGVEFEHSMPVRLMRARLRYSGHLARQKGTTEGLRGLINTTLGWDAEVSNGRNLMLDNHQASFVLPHYEDWTPLINYAQGERVRFQRFTFEAKIGTYNNMPRSDGTDTTWWHTVGPNDALSYVDGTGTLANWYRNSTNESTGNPSTWDALSLTPGVVGLRAIGIGSGVVSPVDPGGDYVNSLVIKNDSQTTAGDFIARSVSRKINATSLDPGTTVTDGLPLRYAFKPWDAIKVYAAGDLVLFHGKVYSALSPVEQTSPTDATKWAPLGVDKRIRFCMSGYTNQPASNISAVDQRVPVTPSIDFYDVYGRLIVTADGRAYPQVKFDSFASNWTTWDTSRPLDVGTGSWNFPLGSWISSGWDDGVAYPVPAAGRKMVLQTGLADTQVGVTLRTSPAASGDLQGIVFRYSDASNYFRAGRNTLQKVVAGVKTVLGTYPVPFFNNDRLTVRAQGSTITVSRNGVAVLTVTDTFNSTAVMHGMVVEPDA
jgi:hypothetical protein